jgi:hypothetical protein
MPIEKLWMDKQIEILAMAKQNSFSIFSNQSNEVEILTQPGPRFVWRRGTWKLFDTNIISNFLSHMKNTDDIVTIAKTIYAMSKIRHGTLLLFPDNDNDNIDDCFVNSMADENNKINSFIHWLESTTNGVNITELQRTRDVISILSTDGLTSINSFGNVVGTGLMVNTENARKSDLHGGARTLAAKAASKYGKVIKVSEDGPIEFYHNGERLYTFG